MNEVILIAHNIRSSYNIGSLLRTADGLGVRKVYISGYTTFPPVAEDSRLPHEIEHVGKQIRKTSLGAEEYINWQRVEEPSPLLNILSKEGYEICALEQTKKAIILKDFVPKPKTVLIVGSEVGGVANDLLSACSMHLAIPMRGQKDSLNVSVAAAIALYHLVGI